MGVVDGAKAVFHGIIPNSAGEAMNMGINSYFALDAYQESRNEGHGKLRSAAAAGFDYTLMKAMGFGAYMGLQLVQSAPGLAYDGYQMLNSYRRNIGRQMKQQIFQNAQFNDTEQTYTMRQAGMAIAQRSRYNTQQAMLGQEAKYMLK